MNITKNLMMFDIYLSNFTLFVEYFIIVSVLYFTVLLAALRENIEKFHMQKSISEFFAVILMFSCFLVINDDVLYNGGSLCCNSSIINGPISFYSKLIVCFFSAIFFFIIADYLNQQKLIDFEYLLILMFSILGLILLCSSFDLLTSYLAIELISLSSYLLSAFRKNNIFSVEAGLKYFIIGSISSAFFLLGTTFLYASTGSIYFHDFNWLFNNQVHEYHYMNFTDEEFFKIIFRGEILHFIFWWENFEAYDFEKIACHDFIKIGIMLIAFSIFVKLALAPFHLWSLDVYEYSPTISVFYFSTITKLSFFIFIIRFFYQSWNSTPLDYDNFIRSWQNYFLITGLISLFVGSVGGITTHRLKTLIAYSSISHMGYNIIAISFAKSFSYGVISVLLYLIIYMLTGLCFWYIILILRLKHIHCVIYPIEKSNILIKKYSKDIEDISLLCKAQPALALGLSFTMFSLAGLPPFIGFVAKLSFFIACIQDEYYFIPSFAALCSVISTFYYIKVVKIIYFEDRLVGKLFYPISHEKSIVLSVFVFLPVFLFAKPTFLYLFVQSIIFDVICKYNPYYAQYIDFDLYWQ